jgi:hypothetical protein
MSAQISRFAGTIKILRFNIGFYAVSAASLLIAALLLITHFGPDWLRALVVPIAALGAYWTLSSLLASVASFLPA